MSRTTASTSAAIFESHSDSGGHSWSKAKEISGANSAICIFQEDGPAGVCDEDQFSNPAVAPDGTVYVAFENSQNTALWEPGEINDDQYLIVKSTDMQLRDFSLSYIRQG